jgi:hypothetical protein
MKTHYNIDVEPASESDPEGQQVLACGRDGVDHTTRNRQSVTCQACRRALRPMKRHPADSRSR